MAAKAKITVAAIETQIVSQMLPVTSGSFAVANRLCGLVFRNIPSKGARMKSSTRAPRKIRIRRKGWSLFFNFCRLSFVDCHSSSRCTSFAGSLLAAGKNSTTNFFITSFKKIESY